jgi:hypothetical protein
MCGGVDIETKFCIPKTSKCPINNLALLTLGEYLFLPPGKFDENPIKITDNLYLAISRYDE